MPSLPKDALHLLHGRELPDIGGKQAHYDPRSTEFRDSGMKSGIPESDPGFHNS